MILVVVPEFDAIELVVVYTDIDHHYLFMNNNKRSSYLSDLRSSSAF